LQCQDDATVAVLTIVVAFLVGLSAIMVVAEEEGNWADWLQTHRVELNAMSTPQFIEWLDGKMEGYSKLIPPADVIEAELSKSIEAKVRAAITERILREAGIENQVATAIAAIDKPDTAALVDGIHELFESAPDKEWRDYIEAVASVSAAAADDDAPPF
jgi:hypothetical protein